MATIYTSDSNKTLSEFVKEIIDINSNIVIPDLQRPYIWNPNQVILLIDSIFKKWPFGSLLCWKVKVSNNHSNFIPYRPFWENVVREIKDKTSKETSITKSSNSYLMILDGQQRIQSLLLALGGDSWGFILPDKEWKKYIDGVDESIDNKHWSAGCLCLNIESFLKQYEVCNKIIAGIDVGKCISWVITDEINGHSSIDKKQVLPISSLIDGKYLRFSKLWNTAKPVGSLAKDYEKIIRNSFEEIPQNLVDNFLMPLSEFMTVIADVKEYTTITRLIIKDFEDTGIGERKIYNNAIVNIFARLNTAGRALSPQEITLAWLKTGWREANSENKDFNSLDCAIELESLLFKLNDGNKDDSGMLMTMDNLVDILSLIWIVIEKNGENKNELLLNDKDLVNGDIIKRIGTSTYKYWSLIKEVLIECKETFEYRKLNECFSRSFYAFYILCGWKFLATLSSKQNEGRIRETECKFDIQINTSFDEFIDRWYLTTQLSDTWSKSDSYPAYVSLLCKLHKKIDECNDPNKAIELLKNVLQEILNSLKQTSINKINSIRAYSRREVIAYKNLLWFWNKLSIARWSEVQKPMKRRRAQPKQEVDHTIPIAIWEKKIESMYPIDQSTDKSTGNEIEFQINGVSFTRSSLVSFINVIGNCSLLLRSHNRSKSDEQFGNFLKDIYSEEQVGLVKNAIMVDDVFLFPENEQIEVIISKINERTTDIKKELIEYINNTRQRVDIS